MFDQVEQFKDIITERHPGVYKLWTVIKDIKAEINHLKFESSLCVFKSLHNHGSVKVADLEYAYV